MYSPHTFFVILSSFFNISLITPGCAIITKLDELELETNPLDFAEQINLALSGEPVEDVYFVKALKEILPECNYTFSQNANNLSNDILGLIKSIARPSANEISVYNNESPEKNKGYILFTNEEMSNYSFLVRRLDGLRMYLYM